jgi:hypothetical protein
MKYVLAAMDVYVYIFRKISQPIQYLVAPISRLNQRLVSVIPTRAGIDPHAEYNTYPQNVNLAMFELAIQRSAFTISDGQDYKDKSSSARENRQPGAYLCLLRTQSTAQGKCFRKLHIVSSCFTACGNNYGTRHQAVTFKASVAPDRLPTRSALIGRTRTEQTSPEAGPRAVLGRD